MTEPTLTMLDLNDESIINDITERLAQEEAPHAAEIVAALYALNVNTNERTDELPGETIEMRRSHLTALVFLLAATCMRLSEIFRAIDLEGRIPDDDMLDPVRDGFDKAGEGLTAIIDGLQNPRRG